MCEGSTDKGLLIFRLVHGESGFRLASAGRRGPLSSVNRRPKLHAEWAERRRELEGLEKLVNLVVDLGKLDLAAQGRPQCRIAAVIV